MLLIFYEYVKDVLKVDYLINYVFLYAMSNPEYNEDLEIIKQDYEIIAKKIKEGKAHLLSESDTRYLGACTKSSNGKVLTSQIGSDIKAKPRAFALKQPYMTYLINNYITQEETYRTQSIYHLKKDKEKNGKYNNFDDYVMALIKKYVGKTEEELYSLTNIKANAKHANILMVNKLLGATEQVREFVKANIKIKTIRVKKNGLPKESMSFPKFTIMQLIKENFDESRLCNYFLETRFLFVVFMEDEYGDYRLKGAKFWNMPIDDLDKYGREDWERIKNKFISGVNFEIKNNGKNVIVKNDLPKKSSTKIFHIRPHAQRGCHVINGIKYGNGLERDMDILPNGDKMTKQCFWLNNDYIKEIIKDVIEVGTK